MRREYNRLVRDKVPDIITHSGRRCEYRILSESEVILALQDKLIEKADKFSKRPSEEEVSDIFELLDAIIVNTGPNAYRRPDGIGVVPLALLGS